MSEPIRVLVADDHAVVREGLKLFLDLQEGIEVVGEAADGAEAIEKAAALGPDVVLMDVVMPNTTGVEATLEIMASCPATSVLVLTSFLEDESVRSVLRAGATGYLLKDCEPGEVADAIRKVHRGDPLIHPEALKRLLGDLAAPVVGGEAVGSPSTADPGTLAGTMTVAFTDISNSSEIIMGMGDEGARPIFREHDRIVRDLVSKHAGTEVEHTGDGFVLVFRSAREAVRCGMEVMRAFDEYTRQHAERPVHVRIGMHTGDLISEREGYYGEAMWLGARVFSKASPDQLLVSELTQRVVGAHCPCADRGEFELKGIPGRHRLYEVSWREA